MQAYLGIDPSLRQTGICLIHPGGIMSWAIKTSDKTSTPYMTIFSEASDFFHRIGSAFDASTLTVGIEQYAFHMAASQGYSWTIEAGGILKLAVQSAGFPDPIPVPASAWKSLLFNKQTLAPKKTGPGWKQNYLSEMRRVSGHNFPTPDEADAWCVATYLRKLGTEKA